MHTFYQNFIGTADEWKNENPRLYKGVVGIEMEADGSYFIKVGDGVHAWGQLPYLKTENIKGLPERLQQLIQDAAEEAQARAAADTALQGNIDAEASTRLTEDTTLQGNIDAEASTRLAEDTTLQENIDAEASTRLTEDTTLQGNIDAKIDKAAAGEPGTLLQSITIKENTPSSVIVTRWNRNVVSPGEAVADDLPLPMASGEQAGIMPKESFSQIGENMARIAALEGKAIHYSVTLASASPSQTDLQAAYEASSGQTGEAADQVTLDDTAFGKSYTWYENSALWVDRGSSSVGQFSNTSPGLIKGSNADGKLFAEEDGTGSVVGWDNLKSRTSNLESAKVDKSGSNSLMTPEEHTKLSGIAAGAQVNPGAATSSAPGLMSAEDKTKLNGIAEGATADAASTTAPKMNGTAAAGSEAAFARGDHVHPSDTAKINTTDLAVTPAAGKVAVFDASGRLKSGAAPSADNDVVRKADLDAFWAAKLSLEYPVGSLYVQYPSDLTPAQKSLPGNWEPWSYRASLYAIGNTAPSEAFKNDWKTYRHDIWLLNTDGSVATLGTKKYTKPAGYTCVERQTLQSSWTAADLTEGTQVTIEGETKYIWQVITFAGIFFGGEDSGYLGGNKRPAYISGGVQPGRTKNIEGNAGNRTRFGTYDGAFSETQQTSTYSWGGGDTYNGYLDISRVVPTGNDFAGTNVSIRFWRRKN
jgi:hypothetical protein